MTPFGKENVWHVHIPSLGAEPRVLSAGVGHDISFEKELATYLGARILLFDPSPTGAETMSKSENRHTNIEYLPLGIAGEDGARSFSAPANAEEGSFWIGAEPADRRVLFQCRSISSICAERGWQSVDLIKLDIEGFEYDALKDLLRSGVVVNQLCVEFHHFMAGIAPSRTLGALRDLYRAGFRIVYKSGSDYTLLHRASTGSAGRRFA